jgi:tRNA A37 threonylcarbamoyladenosine dehydratase
VPAVWSAEDPVYAWADGTCNARPEPGAAVRLDCAAGLGSAVFVTGLFGLAAAGEVVRRIARGSEGTAAVVAAAEKKVPAGTVG